jgi:hypothetical protein
VKPVPLWVWLVLDVVGAAWLLFDWHRHGSRKALRIWAGPIALTAALLTITAIWGHFWIALLAGVVGFVVGLITQDLWP